ncbi:MAG: dTMP kinase [Chitinophagaceae bacterium]
MFIAFEGIDGSGKSTQAKMLANYFVQKGKQVELTAEPTKHSIGKIIRAAFAKEIELQESTIAALFAADRLEHIQAPNIGMLAQLDKGKIVITDRYYLSSYAYHSVHVPMNWVIQSNSLAASILKPTIHFFIDVEPKVAMQRILATRTNIELYETEENLIAVRNNYLKAFDLIGKSEKIVLINGNQSTENVFQDIITVIQNF